MSEVQAKFELKKITAKAEFKTVELKGRVCQGQVSSGMQTKVWVDGGLYMKALIKAVEYEKEGADRGLATLVLDAPESDVRELWLALCQAGDMLAVEARM